MTRSSSAFDKGSGETFTSHMGGEHSTLNIVAGCIDGKDCGKSAFVMLDGLHELSGVSFGLCIAPATFERTIDSSL